MENLVRVNTWNELQDELFSGSWVPSLERFRSPYAFRGMGNAEERLDSSLVRLGGDYARMERHLLRNFRKYARRTSVEVDSDWNWLSIAKHHGLPTRLLDWTYSPFVAMHFATQNTALYDRDGVIWAVNFNGVHHFLPEKLKVQMEKEGSNVLTVDMLSETVTDLDDLEQLSPSDFIVFFEPPSLDERIVNQFALFCMSSNPRITLDEWLEQHPDLYRKIVIPAELKWEIRDKLDQANITERVLFPGLDGLSAWLARMYSPRNF